MDWWRGMDKLAAFRFQPGFSSIRNAHIVNFSQDAGWNHECVAKLRQKLNDVGLCQKDDRRSVYDPMVSHAENPLPDPRRSSAPAKRDVRKEDRKTDHASCQACLPPDPAKADLLETIGARPQ